MGAKPPVRLRDDLSRLRPQAGQSVRLGGVHESGTHQRRPARQALARIGPCVQRRGGCEATFSAFTTWRRRRRSSRACQAVPNGGGLMPYHGAAGRWREKFLAGVSPRFPLVSTVQASMEQTRIHQTGRALPGTKDLLAMAIPSRIAGPLGLGASLPPSGKRINACLCSLPSSRAVRRLPGKRYGVRHPLTSRIAATLCRWRCRWRTMPRPGGEERGVNLAFRWPVLCGCTGQQEVLAYMPLPPPPPPSEPAAGRNVRPPCAAG